MQEEAKIAPEHGGPFRNVWMVLSESIINPQVHRVLADDLAARAAQRSRFRDRRRKGALDETTRQIRTLVAAYPALLTKELLRKAGNDLFSKYGTDNLREQSQRGASRARRAEESQQK